ncbi:anhydro-N-acetylmuramic acid kinase [Leeuwenhoekiella sp. W20_SRS_FM14]|uniref:anhydro-N-acetylmuramic acid kinase n=1 Tax=Leeuwenhoekiella sp. W20_SRS_FM14 TaxID=3240270 RepID=UPI003F9C8AB2
MNSTRYTVLGVMSGTSLDGVDLAYIRFTKKDNWEYELLDCETIAYESSWVVRLRDAVSQSRDALQELDLLYTEYLATLINDFRKRHPLKDLDIIASHGHTILHQPDQGYTYQIGNLPQLAKLCNILVVCDFRVEDVALGGQGAPLVPIGDALLFNNYGACLNIGGFANISFSENNTRIAYDICATNIVLNSLTIKLGFDFDKDGEIAASGTIDQALLDKLNTLPFYKQNYPKSLGLEWVKATVFPILEQSGLAIEDRIATYTEHMAVQLAHVLKNCKAITPSNGVLVTGGGAYNAHLMQRLEELSGLKITRAAPKMVEFKEALIFGFMGVLRLRNTINVLRSVTGASKDHCAGKLYSP